MEGINGSWFVRNVAGDLKACDNQAHALALADEMTKELLAWHEAVKLIKYEEYEKLKQKIDSLNRELDMIPNNAKNRNW